MTRSPLLGYKGNALIAAAFQLRATVLKAAEPSARNRLMRPTFSHLTMSRMPACDCAASRPGGPKGWREECDGGNSDCLVASVLLSIRLGF